MNRAPHEEDRDESAGIMEKTWEKQQIRSFTAWVNTHLQKVGSKIEDIATDFESGINLIKLVEVISNDTLQKPERGRMRIHKIQNINIALESLKGKGLKLRTEAESIADHNMKMILGLVWMIILRFQIQDINVEEMSAKEGLLLWCKRKTAGYEKVKVDNFTKSFRDGLAFCALINRHRPDLLDYNSLDKSPGAAKQNLQLAFDVAEKHLNIPQMLDADEMLSTSSNDERSVITYVAAYYHAFSSSNSSEDSARAIDAILAVTKEVQAMILDYETRASNLLEWINKTIQWLGKADKVQSITEFDGIVKTYRGYKKSEKPPKASERASLEAHYTTLQTKLQLNNRPPYHPVEGKTVSDINTAWVSLKDQEKLRDLFLTSEHIRITRLIKIHKQFNTKTTIHKRWLVGKTSVIDQPLGENLGEIEQNISLVDALDSLMSVHSSTVSSMDNIVKELDDSQFWEIDAVKTKNSEIQSEWARIKDKCTAHKEELIVCRNMEKIKEDKRIEFAKQAAQIAHWCDEAQEQLMQDTHCDSISETDHLINEHTKFNSDIANYKGAHMDDMVALSNEMKNTMSIATNRYTSHTEKSLSDLYKEIVQLSDKRSADLTTEREKQVANEELRRSFATSADKFASSMEKLKPKLGINISSPLDEQLVTIKQLISEIDQLSTELNNLHKISDKCIERKIFDNSLAAYTIEEISAMYEQLKALGARSKNTIQNQILMKSESGITEDKMREYRETFMHFDKTGKYELSRNEFRSCLLAIGFDLQSGEDHLNEIMRTVDPENGSCVKFEMFINFMASQVKKDSTSKAVFLENFKVISENKDYITEAQIIRTFPKESAEYLLHHMKSDTTNQGLDFIQYANKIFA